jgi:hypothetical protein
MLLKQILCSENCLVTKYISQLHLALLVQFFGVVNEKYQFKIYILVYYGVVGPCSFVGW